MTAEQLEKANDFHSKIVEIRYFIEVLEKINQQVCVEHFYSQDMTLKYGETGTRYTLEVPERFHFELIEGIQKMFEQHLADLEAKLEAL